MPANHTPTPWHVQPIGGQRYVEAEGPKLICDMQADGCLDPADVAEMEANAEFIVRACNCHEELVEALELAAKLYCTARQHFPKSMHNGDKFQLENVSAAIGKVLAKAKGQP